VQSERISPILNKMERIVAIGEAADVLGVSIVTLRRWEAAGKLAAEHTVGGRRRDDVAK
jgi:putative resolvase